MIYLLALPLLWVLFLAYAGLRAKWGTLRPEVKLAGAFVMAAGLALDIAVNWTIGLLLGITKDVTLSQKCKRLKVLGGWRGSVATYLCHNWLNPFDPEHC